VKVLILGKGLVGKALVKRLSSLPDYEVIVIGRSECDLRDQTAAQNLFTREVPAVCILAAGVAGGIQKNIDCPTELIIENSKIILNVVQESISHNIPRLINLVPACVYPANIPRRMQPKDLFTSPMEMSSLAYSTSKLAGLVMVDAIRKQYGLDWVSIIATNLYGDNSEAESSGAHVIPALLAKFIDAKKKNFKSIELFGDGTSVREFLHVDDFANAVAKFLDKDRVGESIINVSGSQSIKIKDLATLIKEVVGFEGDIIYKRDGKNGAPMKLLDGDKFQGTGWQPEISLEEGLTRVVGQMLRNT